MNELSLLFVFPKYCYLTTNSNNNCFIFKGAFVCLALTVHGRKINLYADSW